MECFCGVKKVTWGACGGECGRNFGADEARFAYARDND